MLDAAATAQLKSYLERVQVPIELIASVDDGAKSRELLELLNETAALSEKITVRADGEDARRPSFIVSRIGTDVAVNCSNC